MATDPAVEAAQTYLHNVFCGTPSCALDCLADARSVVAAVTPLIRAQAFTEAADVLDREAAIQGHTNGPMSYMLRYHAERVRGLSEETENA